MRLQAIGLLALALAAEGRAQEAPARRPIIDVHLHGGPGRPASQFYSVPPSGSLDSAFLMASFREMDRYNVVLALTSMRGGNRYASAWRAAAQDRLVVGPQLTWDDEWPDTAQVRRELAAGRMGMIGELGYVYLGLPPTDARVEAYFALAHEFDVPVGVHIGRRRAEMRPPGCCPNFNDDYGDPALLRPILNRYPGLRLYLMHVGGADPEFFDRAIALMRDYPNVYADMSVVAMRAPRDVFYGNLRRLIREDLLNRVMFGSDGAAFIGPHVQAFDSVPFLTAAQLREIYYKNAARFLRLTEQGMRRSPSR